jgi:hypothetical protein
MGRPQARHNGTAGRPKAEFQKPSSFAKASSCAKATKGQVGGQGGGVSPGGWSRKPVLEAVNIGEFAGRTRTVTRTVAYWSRTGGMDRMDG